jgi:peptidoglycan/LPS O-acetylase OafA/YrhL
VKYRADIDGLRAVAVLSVVVYHALPEFLTGGFVGVDIFFVISGYLITRIVTEDLAEGRFSYVQFYQRRIMRLMPAFTVMAASTTTLAYVFYAPDDLERYAKSIVATVLLYSNHYFLHGTGYFEAPKEVTPMLHMWSLSVEEQFYVIFPSILVVIAKRNYSTPVLIGGLAVASFVASCVMLPRMQDLVFFLLPFRAWELLIGAFLAVKPVSLGPSLGLIGAALIACPLFLLNDNSPFPGWNALAPCLGAALIISSQLSVVSKALSLSWLNYIGRTSYSFYLWHWPVIAFATYLLGRAMNVSEGLAAILASFCLGVLSYHFVEIPFRGRREPFVTGGILLFASVLLALNFYLNRTDGAPWRLPPKLQALAEEARKHAGPPSSQCKLPDLIASDSRLSPLGGLTEARICKVGDQNAPVHVIVWGDSHANAMAPALDTWLAARGMAAYSLTRGGCPPLIGLERQDSSQWQCRTFNEAVQAVVEAIDTHAIFITARWPFYVEAAGFGSETRKPPFFGQTAKDNFSLIQSSLAESLKWAKAHADKVALVGPTPEIGEDVVRGLARRSFQLFPMDVSVGRSLVDLRQARTVDMLEHVSANARVQYINVLPLYCDERTCLGGNEQHLIFLDANHIAPAAAKKIEGLLTPLIRSTGN